MVLMVIAIFLMCTNLRASITSISPLLNTIEHSLGFNAVTASLLTSLPVFCMGIFAPLAAGIGGRIGLAPTVFWAVALIGIATALRLVAISAPLLIFTAVLAGTGIAIAGPVMSGFIKAHFPHRAPIMVGVYSGGLGIGATISAGLSIPLKNAFSNSWSISLAFWTVFAVMGLGIWIPILRRSSQTRMQNRSSNRSPLPWNQPKAWMLVVLFALQSGLYYTLAAFFAPALEQRGLSALGAGDVMTAFSLVNMVTGIVLPMLLPRAASRMPWLVGCGLLMLVGVCALAWLPTTVSPWLIALVLGLGSGGSFTLTLILPLDFTDSGEETSAWTAMMQCGGYLLSAAVPLAAGAIRDASGNYTIVFIGLAALAAFFSIISVFLPRRPLAL